MRLGFLDRAFWALVLWAAVGVAPAHAQFSLDGGKQAWFFNRPGVTAAEHKEDLRICGDFVAKMNKMKNDIPPINQLLGELFVKPGYDNAAIAGCMHSMGYRRFDISGGKMKAFSTRLAAMTDQQLEDYVATETPPEGQLSQDNKMGPALAKPRMAEPMKLRGMPAMTNVAEYDSAKNAIVAVEFKDDLRFNAPLTLALAQLDAEKLELAKAADGFVPIYSVDNPKDKRKKTEAITKQGVFVVSPGTYILYGHGVERLYASCLRTVAVQVRAGDVVDLGTWKMALIKRPGDQYSIAEISWDGPSPTFEETVAKAVPDPSRIKRGGWMNNVAFPCFFGGGFGVVHIPDAPAFTPEAR
jgi:hypothetical protein